MTSPAPSTLSLLPLTLLPLLAPRARMPGSHASPRPAEYLSRASTPSAALSTALASLRLLAPLLPSPSLSATDDPLDPRELLCADLLPLKLSHGGGLAWRDVEGACALLPLAQRGDSAEQLGEEAWERWLTEKAVQGVVRVLQALNDGKGHEACRRVCEWVTGLVRVVEQKVEAQGKGKGKAVVVGCVPSLIG